MTTNRPALQVSLGKQRKKADAEPERGKLKTKQKQSARDS